MSNGDEDPADSPEAADGPDESEAADAADERQAADAEETAMPTLSGEPTEESLNEYLDEIAALLDDAETEADLDDVEALLDDAEEALAEADLPEPDEDDEDADDPRADLEERVDELREELADARGPYAEDVVAAVEESAETVETAEWTEAGIDDVADAVESFVVDVSATIDTTVALKSRDPAALATALEAGAAAIDDAGLDPDDDAEAIADLLAAAESLDAALEDAEEWDDLETRDQLRAQGYYDVLGHYKDFPVEWSALKEHEQRGNVDMVMLALDSMASDFMEQHCLEALDRMGKRGKTEESLEELLDRAGKRDKFAIRILGKMAAEEATETLLEYVDEDSNPGLQKVTFAALGAIGAEEAVGPLANKLEMEDTQVRPRAARALGLIGDTRAIDPLADALAEDDSDDVRAAAGWALRQIGTREALETVAEYGDERVYIVQSEAEKATAALDGAAPTA